MSYSTEETYQVYNITPRKARKQHKCSACQERIEPGHRYFVVSMIYDGEARSCVSSNRKPSP